MEKSATNLTQRPGRMNALREIPIVSPDAGDATVQSDPNSPEAIAKRARSIEAQSGADMKYDARPPARIENYQDWVEIVWDGDDTRETMLGLFLASAVLLLLYSAAPNPV